MALLYSRYRIFHGGIRRGSLFVDQDVVPGDQLLGPGSGEAGFYRGLETPVIEHRIHPEGWRRTLDQKTRPYPTAMRKAGW